MKPVTPEQARVWGNTGKLTPAESSRAVHELRGVGTGTYQGEPKFERIVLSQCVPLPRKGRTK